jgi:hypothetical protein
VAATAVARVVVALVVVATPRHAAAAGDREPAEREPGDRRGCETRMAPVVLSIENDSLVGRRRDGGYSSGVRLEVFGGAAATYLRLDRWIETAATPGLATRCTPAGRAGGGQRSLFLQQQILTPRDIMQIAPQPDDQPWAAMVSMGRGWDVVGLSGATLVARRVELAVNVVGDAALGHQSQRIAHRWIDGDDPKGWDNQLRNRWGLSATVLERRRRSLAGRLPSGPGAGSASASLPGVTGLPGDVIGHWGATLGHIVTDARLGATLRLGHTGCVLTTPGLIAHSIGLGGAAASDCPDASGLHGGSRDGLGRHGFAFVGFDLRRVVRNELLEGAPRVGTSTISAAPWVAELRLGVAWGDDDWSLSYALTRRSGEFRNGLGDRSRPATFAALVLAVAW